MPNHHTTLACKSLVHPGCRRACHQWCPTGCLLRFRLVLRSRKLVSNPRTWVSPVDTGESKLVYALFFWSCHCSPSEISDKRSSFSCKRRPSTNTSTRPHTCRFSLWKGIGPKANLANSSPPVDHLEAIQIQGCHFLKDPNLQKKNNTCFML